MQTLNTTVTASEKGTWKPSILAVILARAGSKRLPGKNVADLHGKPLLAWSIETVQACKTLTASLVSTDSTPFAEVARQWGAEAPFLRPEHLADDAASSEDAVLHALSWLEERGQRFDAVVLVEPTSPLRHSQDLTGVLELLTTHWQEADAVVAVGEVQLEKPHILKHRDNRGFITPWLVHPPADRGTAWFPYGGMYAIKTETLRTQRTFYPERMMGYPVQPWQHYEVDNLYDFLCVDAIIASFGGILP